MMMKNRLPLTRAQEATVFATMNMLIDMHLDRQLQITQEYNAWCLTDAGQAALAEARYEADEAARRDEVARKIRASNKFARRNRF
jgi:hypothetical protein